ncbi:exodeoxyribonuclease V subunit gamma [Psittacicella gerlachiana]|nr:exodeoxyribonuclease V subunit gamma [Psittacicella gerlachiana]
MLKNKTQTPTARNLDLRQLEQNFKSKDIIVVTNDLQKQQIERQLQQLPGVQVLPRFINETELVRELVRLFAKKVNQQEILVHKISDSVKNLIADFPQDVPEDKFFNLYNIEIISARSEIILWQTVEYLNEQIRLAPTELTNAFLVDIVNQIKEQINFADQEELVGQLYFVAKNLHELINTLYAKYSQLIIALSELEFNEQKFTQLLAEYITLEQRDNPLLQGQLLVIREIILRTRLFLQEFAKANNIEKNFIYLNTFDMLNLIADSEFSLSSTYQASDFRLFLMDKKIYSPRELLIIQKASRYLGIEVYHFLNITTPLLFDTQSRKVFLNTCNQQKLPQVYHQYLQPNYILSSSNASYNLLSLLGSGLKKLLQAFAFDLDHEYQTYLEHKQTDQATICDANYYLPLQQYRQAELYAEYNFFVDPLNRQTYYPRHIYEDLTQELQKVYQQINQQNKLTPEQITQVFTQLDKNPELLASLTKLQTTLTSGEQPSLLQQLQKSFLEYTDFAEANYQSLETNNLNQQPSGFLHLRGDDSFTIVQTNSRRRELEYAIDFVQQQLALSQEELSLNDFLILAPNIEIYRDLIEQVIDKENFFSYQIEGYNQNQEELKSFYNFIFTLNANYLDLKTFKKWLTFKGVKDFYQLNEEDLEFYPNLFGLHQVTNELGYNYSKEYQAQTLNHILPIHNQVQSQAQTTSIKNELNPEIPVLNYNSWQHVFFRANLNNSFSHGEDLSLFLSTDLPFAQSSQKYASLSKFNCLITDLALTANFINQKHNFEQWLEFLNNLRIQFFKHQEELSENFKQTLQKIAKDLKLTHSSCKKVDKFVVHNQLVENKVSINPYLSRNRLTFASLSNASGTSYKYVICLGLDKNFPTQPKENPLSIVSKLKLIDNNPSIYQTNQHFILELINNTQKKLVLTYAGGEEQPCASILSDIKEFIQKQLYLPQEFFAPSQNNQLLKEKILEIFYSSANSPSFIVDLALGSFDVVNYGQAQLDLASNFKEKEINELVVSSSRPSFNQHWLPPTNEPIEKQEFGNLSQTLQSFKQIFSLPKQEALTYVQSPENFNTASFINVSIRKLADFIKVSANYGKNKESRDMRIDKEQKIVEYQYQLESQTTYGLTFTDNISSYFSKKIIEETIQGKEPTEILSQDILNGGKIKTSLIHNKQINLLDYQNFKLAIKEGQGIYPSDYYINGELFEEVPQFKGEEKHEYLYFKLNPEFCENYVNYFLEHNLTLGNSQLLFQELAKLRQSGNFEQVYLRIPISYSLQGKKLLHNRFFDKDFLTAATVKLNANFAKITFYLEDYFKLFAAMSKDQVNKLVVYSFISQNAINTTLEAIQAKCKKLEAMSEKLEVTKQVKVLSSEIDLEPLQQQIQEELGKGLSQMLMHYLLGKDLLLPLYSGDKKKSFLTELFTNRYVNFDKQEIQKEIDEFFAEFSLDYLTQGLDKSKTNPLSQIFSDLDKALAIKTK